jgi:MOSC domain-containing protein YiiM
MEADILSIATGKIKTYGSVGNIFQSGYKKDCFFNYIAIDQFGLEGDTQVDKKHHGGEDKAILIASSKHLKDDMDKLSFGQNILIDRYDESDINIGDIYSIGDILVEVSQPRQPCWKIGAIFSKEISRYIVKNKVTGWYVRVLQGGILDINDTMKLETRVTNITIKELTIYLKNPPTNQNLIDEILNIKPLATSYKKDFQKVLNR